MQRDMDNQTCFEVDMGMLEEAIDGIRRICDQTSARRVALDAKMNPSTLTRWLSGERTPEFKTLAPLLSHLNAKIVFPDYSQDTTRPVKICGHMSRAVHDQIQIHESIEEAHAAAGPDSEDYIAVPLADMPVAAGPGLLPNGDIRGWVLAWKYQASIMWKSNLVAVEIGKNQTSMVPVLHPGDIVLVNRDDWEPNPPGKIMLVCEPDGSAAIKRVSMEQEKNRASLVFYSENSAEYPPKIFNINEKYEGDIRRAIAGRIIWSWSDMTKK